ncbi:MAG: plastocyanin/azurin family copper-binding protein [Solirubrobacterales bacterium]
MGITAFGLLLLWPGAAHAANTRVSIANYAWGQPRVEVNRGEKVTWDWLGPDLAHSVTGISPDSVQWDSDAGDDAPEHRAGDTYTIQFDTPGEYFFQCKLHAAVRGEVVVTDIPGDPNSNPGPQPPLNLDLRPPTLGSLALARRSTKGDGGIAFSAQISERGRLDAEYYRFNSKGKRIYNGFARWKTFIGINHLRLGERWKHFRARPGRYLAVLRATDEAANESKPLRKRFKISG